MKPDLLLVDTPPTVLPGSLFWQLLGLIVVMVVGTGLVLVRRDHNARRTGADPNTSVVRSWLAASLVGGLLLMTGAAFFIADTTLRSLLTGGLVASGGSAVAYYFAAQGGEKTQQNLLNAAFGVTQVKVPDVTGLKIDAAKKVIESVGLKFTTAIPAGDPVASCVPPVGTAVPNDSLVTGLPT